MKTNFYILTSLLEGNRWVCGFGIEARISIRKDMSSIPPGAFCHFSRGEISGKFRECLPASRNVKYQQGPGTSMTNDHGNLRKFPDFGKMRENFCT
jgi:hypothetical protein